METVMESIMEREPRRESTVPESAMPKSTMSEGSAREMAACWKFIEGFAFGVRHAARSA